MTPERFSWRKEKKRCQRQGISASRCVVNRGRCTWSWIFCTHKHFVGRLWAGSFLHLSTNTHSSPVEHAIFAFASYLLGACVSLANVSRGVAHCLFRIISTADMPWSLALLFFYKCSSICKAQRRVAPEEQRHSNRTYAIGICTIFLPVIRSMTCSLKWRWHMTNTVETFFSARRRASWRLSESSGSQRIETNDSLARGLHVCSRTYNSAQCKWCSSGLFSSVQEHFHSVPESHELGIHEYHPQSSLRSLNVQGNYKNSENYRDCERSAPCPEHVNRRYKWPIFKITHCNKKHRTVKHSRNLI